MKKKTRCWKGYKPVPGKKPFSKGSCAPVSEGAINYYERIFVLLEGIYTDENDRDTLMAGDPITGSSVVFRRKSPKAGTGIAFNADDGLAKGIVAHDADKRLRKKAAIIARRAREGQLMVNKISGRIVPHPLAGNKKNFVTPEKAKELMKRSAERN